MMTEGRPECGDVGGNEEGGRDARRFVPVRAHGESGECDGKHTAVVPVGLGREWVGRHADRPFLVNPDRGDPGLEGCQARLDSLGYVAWRVERVQVGQSVSGKPVVGGVACTLCAF